MKPSSFAPQTNSLAEFTGISAFAEGVKCLGPYLETASHKRSRTSVLKERRQQEVEQVNRIQALLPIVKASTRACFPIRAMASPTESLELLGVDTPTSLMAKAITQGAVLVFPAASSWV